MQAAPIPVTVLTGYLGSGKTTVVNYVLNNQSGLKVAVITNDIGEVNIDAALIEKGTSVSQTDESLVALSNGCICCTLRADLIEQVTELAHDGRFDYILIEASGICEPLPIAQTLTLMDSENGDERLPNICRLDTMATVVDAFRLQTEFMGGEALLRAEEADEEDVTRLLVEQIEFCDLIILNKTDLVDGSSLSAIRSIVKKLQPEARILETSFGKIEPSDILNAQRFDFEEASQSPGWLKELEKAQYGEDETEEDEYGIGSFVYMRQKPFSYDKFCAFLERWPMEVVRCKGLAWFSNQNDDCILLEQAGQSITMAPYGNWLASASPEEQQAAFSESPEILETWDPDIGDRMTMLVFIGIEMNREKIETRLDECLEM
jgi:G3E family GTPase